MARRAANGGLAATAVMTVTSAGGALAIATKKNEKQTGALWVVRSVRVFLFAILHFYAAKEEEKEEEEN